jgi:hypothetical protein
MPEKETVERAKKALKEGKSPTTAAGEFVREEIEHVREGKHGADSPQQAIAIGLSKARRAGIPLPPQPETGGEDTRRSMQQAYEAGQKRRGSRKSSAKRAKASRAALQRKPRGTTSKRALSRQAKSAARRRRSGGSRAGTQNRAGSTRSGQRSKTRGRSAR